MKNEGKLTKNPLTDGFYFSSVFEFSVRRKRNGEINPQPDPKTPLSQKVAQIPIEKQKHLLFRILPSFFKGRFHISGFHLNKILQ